MTARELLIDKNFGVRFSDDADLPEFDRILHEEGMYLYTFKGSYGEVAEWPIRGVPKVDNHNRTLVCGVRDKKRIISYKEFLQMISEEEIDSESDAGLEEII